TMSGVECGPAPLLKFIVSSDVANRYSQIVLPVVASNAVTTSSAFQEFRTPVGGRYIVYSRAPSPMMLEWPSPSVRLHSRFGPAAGQSLASPFTSLVKLLRGPPQPSQADGGLAGLLLV